MNKQKILLNQVITIIIWLVALYFLIFNGFWYIAAAVLLLHITELFMVGYRRGTTAGYSPIKTVLMVLVFGYTWWLYLPK